MSIASANEAKESLDTGHLEKALDSAFSVMLTKYLEFFNKDLSLTSDDINELVRDYVKLETTYLQVKLRHTPFASIRLVVRPGGVFNCRLSKLHVSNTELKKQLGEDDFFKRSSAMTHLYKSMILFIN